jgi:F-type H+-transporting ATPase subunit delta
MKSNRQAKREAKQLFRECLVRGLLDGDHALQTVRSTLAAGRRDGPAILAHFLRFVRLDCARHAAHIESATPLPPDLQAAIEVRLKRRYGESLSTTYALRPALIGGVRIQAASDVYDGSVLAGFEALEKSF